MDAAEKIAYLTRRAQASCRALRPPEFLRGDGDVLCGDGLSPWMRDIPWTVTPSPHAVDADYSELVPANNDHPETGRSF